MFNTETEFKPPLLTIRGISNELSRITQPHETDLINTLKQLVKSQTPKTLPEFRAIIEQHGLYLLEEERSLKQRERFTSYRIVKMKTDAGEIISEKDLFEKAEEFTIAVITFKK